MRRLLLPLLLLAASCGKVSSPPGTTSSIVETGGTYMTMGAVADGEVFTRSGTTVDGVHPGLLGGGVCVLVEKKTIAGAAATTTTFSGLTGDTARFYRWDIQGVNSAGAATYISLRPNGAATGTFGVFNYRRVTGAAGAGAYALATGAVDDTYCEVAHGGASGKNYAGHGWMAAATGRERAIWAWEATENTDGDEYAFQTDECMHNNTATEITSLAFTSSGANGLGIGTVISLYECRGS